MMMPRPKLDNNPTFTWKGKPVSKTTYFRRKAEEKQTKTVAKLMAISAEDVVRMPPPDHEPPRTGPTPPENTMGEATPNTPPVNVADDALLRDMMVGVRNQQSPFQHDRMVSVSPRTFLAILRALDKAGY